MSTVIDFHTHILSGIDDGSTSLQQSIKMLQAEWAQGIEHVMLTPHFYADHDSPERFLKRRRRSLDELQAAMADRKDLPEIDVGAEVKFFDGISDCEYLQDMAVSGTRAILIEMPMTRWTDRMLDELVGIRQKQGLVPVIAHLDRYISPFRTHGLPEKLSHLPVLVQVNAQAFIRSSTRSMVLRLLGADRIHLLGSDCHNLQSRAPDLSRALEIIRKKLGEECIKGINAHESYLAVVKDRV